MRVMTMHQGDVHVGRVTIPLQTAVDWIGVYTDAAKNVASDQPFAFPAYDRYDGGTTVPDHLTDADLLAPGLLNVPVKVRSFYGLQRVRGRLEDALGLEVLGVPLAQVRSTDELAAAVRALYAVLDDPTTRPWGVGGTTLSKVLHRKRPDSVVLHDRWVRACYVGDDAPVPKVQGRSWADYMVLITNAVRADIADQPEAFSILEKAVAGPGLLSHARLLDILAWNSKGDAPAEATDEASSNAEGGEDVSPSP